MKNWRRILLIFFIGLPWLAPAVTSTNPLETNATATSQPPGREHPMGTDGLGRDVLARFLYGGQRSLEIATIGTVTAASLGLALGLTAASFSPVAQIGSTFTGALLALPQILIAFIILTLLGSGPVSLAVATGCAQIASYAWIVQRAIRQGQLQPYVEAAHALGAAPRHILFVHILPGIMPTLAAYTGVAFSYCLLNSAAFSALGLGGELGVPDWGVMLADGRMIFRSAPWVSIAPGLAILIIVSTVNALADKVSRLGNG